MEKIINKIKVNILSLMSLHVRYAHAITFTPRDLWNSLFPVLSRPLQCGVHRTEVGSFLSPYVMAMYVVHGMEDAYMSCLQNGIEATMKTVRREWSRRDVEDALVKVRMSLEVLGRMAERTFPRVRIWRLGTNIVRDRNMSYTLLLHEASKYICSGCETEIVGFSDVKPRMDFYMKLNDGPVTLIVHGSGGDVEVRYWREEALDAALSVVRTASRAAWVAARSIKTISALHSII